MTTVRDDVKAAGDLTRPFDTTAAIRRLDQIDTMTLAELDELETLATEALDSLTN